MRQLVGAVSLRTGATAAVYLSMDVDIRLLWVVNQAEKSGPSKES